ncbi:NAD(+)/NADH kinase [Natrialbaceae archaeon A-gly3]
MTCAEWTPGADPLVGVLEGGVDLPAGELADLEGAVTEAGGDLSSGPIEQLLAREPSVLLAVGEEAALAAVRAETSVPVLPVDAGQGVRSVPGDRVSAALRGVLSGEATRRDLPTLRVDLDGGVVGRALFDVSLVTDEPARISEYSVRSRNRGVACFRADGVVVATPAGSHGYAGAAGGPVLSPELEGVAVVPVGPFVTQTRHWVLPDGEIRLSVERDYDPIALCVDDERITAVDCDSSITITAGGRFPTLVTDESVSYFGDPTSC